MLPNLENVVGCLKLFLILCWAGYRFSAAATGLTIQTSLDASKGQMVLGIQGSNPDWVYSLEASPATGQPSFSTVAVGGPGQTQFTVGIEPVRAMLYRMHGTNQFGHTISPGSVAGPAAHPALGYNSWIENGVGISEELAMSLADAMATNGMRAAGYRYLVLDQGWTGDTRNPDGTPSISTNFPRGIKFLADYVHSKGLLLGLYTTSETNYHGYIGSGGHCAQDGLLYANWGIDYVKFDTDSRSQSEIFVNAFLSSGRSLFFAPSYGDFESWIPSETSSWRGNGGIHRLTDLLPWGVTFGGAYYSGWQIFLEHIDYISRYANTASPGHWNDPDAIDASWYPGSLGKPEMAMCAILSCNMMWNGIPPIESVRAQTLYYMTNSEVLAVHQDSAGIQGTLVSSNETGLGQVWARSLQASNSAVKAVCFLNRSETNSQIISVSWPQLGLSNGPALVRDLFMHANVGNFTNGYSVVLAPKDCQLLSITAGAQQFLQHGTNYLSDQGFLSGFTNGSGSQFQYDGSVWPTNDFSDPGTPMKINGKYYPKGVGTDANCWLQYALSGLATTFHAEIGIDDLYWNRAQAIFRVWLDGRQIYDSGIMMPGSPTQFLNLDISGGQILTLQAVTAEPNGETANDACDWGNAYVICP